QRIPTLSPYTTLFRSDDRPQMLTAALMRGNKSGSVPQTAPSVTSLWPPIIFVKLSMTKSAPSSRGRVRSGVAKVLSTTRRVPARSEEHTSELQSPDHL